MDTITLIEKKAKRNLILAMIVFGTVGIFIKFIGLNPGIMASFRGIIGGLFLLLLTILRGKNINTIAIKNNIKTLLLSGFLIGTNWIFLFEGYRYSTVSIVSLCNYLCPIFLVILSAIFLKEKLNIKKIICIMIALFGMVLVSGILNGEVGINQFKGVLYGTIAGLLYAIVIIINKKLKNIGAIERTFVQVLFAGLVVLPHAIATGGFSNGVQISMISIVLLLVVAIFHTGLNYSMYLSSLEYVSSESVGVISYIDPVVSVVGSSIILGEQLGLLGIIGGILILGAAYISER